MRKIQENKENKLIVDALNLLNNGKFRDKKPFLDELRKGSTTINGFMFQQTEWCWIIWKPTDFEEEPQFKGEALVKIVPRFVTEQKRIKIILKNQSWIYL